MKVAALFVNKVRSSLIAHVLRSKGAEVLPVASIAGLVQVLRNVPVDAVLLEDSPAELIDWLSILQMKGAAQVPVVVVGGAGGFGMAEALAYGATDYAEYVDSPEILMTRLRAHVASRGTQRRQELSVGQFTLHSTRLVVSNGEHEVSLTAREFALAWVLFATAGRVVTLARLSARVWGRPEDVCKRTLEQHIYKLRRKLSDPRFESRLRIQAVYAVGYRLDVLIDNDASAPLARSERTGALPNEQSLVGQPGPAWIHRGATDPDWSSDSG